jgi:ABC-type uncharacterized transport system auxiliary subunit
MTAFKELLVGGYVLRFWPSDNGWMCGITPQMMEALQQQRTWVGLTDEEVEHIADSEWEEAFVRLIEAKLKEKNT